MQPSSTSSSWPPASKDTDALGPRGEKPEPPALMHFPHCRLEITTPSHNFLPAASQSPNAPNALPSTGKLEQVALPGSLVRALLARFESQPDSLPQMTQQIPSQASQSHDGIIPKATTAKRPGRIHLQPHFDDNDEWVFSRCLLADFTGFREDEAEALSRDGSLCCWASVVLKESQTQRGSWDLGFVVHRIGVRDPRSGWCECF